MPGELDFYQTRRAVPFVRVSVQVSAKMLAAKEGVHVLCDWRIDGAPRRLVPLSLLALTDTRTSSNAIEHLKLAHKSVFEIRKII